MILEPERKVEFFYKKSTYIFPVKSKIFLNANRLAVEIANKKVRNISKYVSHNASFKDLHECSIGLPITGNGSRLSKEYQTITDYFKKHPKIDFLQFEYATSRELALCTFFKSADAFFEETFVQEIKMAMPFLINIFTRPLIHLKETDIIQPIDAVKRVNHNTVRNLSTHTENWQSIVNGAIIPSKLLTKVYDDDYSIYENLVFCDLINKILTFLRRRIYNLTEVLGAFKDSIQLDAINRLNHQMYYLAIGKLYVGFSKLENSSEILSMLDATKQLYKQITKYKTRAVYVKNAHLKSVNGAIRKTNILTMHKDYRHVYCLQSKLIAKTIEAQEQGTYEIQAESQKSYELFCTITALFAISNFNMLCKTNGAILENGKLEAYFEYKDWMLNVSSRYNEVLGFNVIMLSMTNKENLLEYMLIPMSYYIANDKKRTYEHIIERLYFSGSICDKYIFLEPFDFDENPLNNYSINFSSLGVDLYYAVLPVSIAEINSFRRIQKLLFECMTLSDEDNETCAFCGEKTVKDAAKRLCVKCRTAIKTVTCSHCKKDFKATYIDVKNKKKVNEEYLNNLEPFYRQEKLYSFRNIVNMTAKTFICPHCGGENKQ